MSGHLVSWRNSSSESCHHEDFYIDERSHDHESSSANRKCLRTHRLHLLNRASLQTHRPASPPFALTLSDLTIRTHQNKQLHISNCCLLRCKLAVLLQYQATKPKLAAVRFKKIQSYANDKFFFLSISI